MIEHGHATHTGLKRAHNEDTYLADTGHGLWLVADGMGGHARGEVASALAVDTVSTAMGAGLGMADAFRRAGSVIARQTGQQHSNSPMGSTLAALNDGTGRFEAARIGDSRIYLWHDGMLHRLLHARATCVEGRQPDGEPETRAAMPRNRATQALGITPANELDAEPVTGHCIPGMRFLICSDGLTEELDDARIGAIVSRTELAAQECVDHLVLAALDAGGRDNITVVLVRIS